MVTRKENDQKCATTSTFSCLLLDFDLKTLFGRENPEEQFTDATFNIKLLCPHCEKIITLNLHMTDLSLSLLKKPKKTDENRENLSLPVERKKQSI